MGVFIGMLVVVGLLIPALVVTAMRRFKRDREAQVAEANYSEAAIAAESDPAKHVARAATPREQRAEEIRLRRATGACLYCDRVAVVAVPQLALLRPVLDPLYRYLNVVPVNRWTIDVDPGADVPYSLCSIHHAIARSHLERRIAENQVDYAAFVERQRYEMYEFESYALDEHMLNDSNTVKRGKKSKKVVDLASAPRPLKAVNGTGS